MNIGIVHTASYLPSVVVENWDICKNIEGLTEQWILEKTGIQKRYYHEPGETASGMAFIVAKRLMHNIPKEDIGLIIIASFSQDYQFPAMSSKIHAMLGAPKDCQIMDINVNCVGLITGTTIAVERMKACKQIKYAMVIGVEILSDYVDGSDKFTAPFFSDGASGILLGRCSGETGYINSFFCTDSSVYEEVKLDRDHYIYQNGKATWTQAITNIPYTLNRLAKLSNIDLEDVDFFIFHQANKVLIDYIMDKIRVPKSKTYTNVERIGNTGAASIGMALDEAIALDFIRKNDTVMLVGVGAGFNFGASLWKI